MNNKKALIAMSGGVDSSVAAYLSVKKGLDCVGVTMKLYDSHTPEDKTCCSEDDIRDAKNVCDRLGMPYYVCNFQDDFKEKVIDKFICAYECGMTPNPCIDCNRYLKFDRLLREALETDCDFVVTGHYAIVEKKDGRYLLKKALDKSKDQTYVLYSLKQDQLSHTMFPLGEMSKSEARAIAEENGFINANKRDSQDICFVPDGDYASVIEKYTGRTYPDGDFVDSDGHILGRHKGIIRYTIGQRKGLGLALPEPMYVREKRIDKNEVVLCRNSELFSKELIAGDFNWIMFDTPPEKVRVNARIRYNQSEQPATAILQSDKTVKIEFDEPQRAIAKGQAVVLYDGDYVVGGGTIL